MNTKNVPRILRTYTTTVWKYDNESSSNGWLIRQNQLLRRDINVSKGQRSEIDTIKFYTSPFLQMTTRPQRTVKKA